MASADPNPSQAQGPSKISSIILRNTLRYTLSAKEYKTLHEYLITRSPKTVRRKTPQPQRYTAIVQTDGDFNAAAVRGCLRVFVGLQTGLKLWDIANEYVLARGKPKK